MNDKLDNIASKNNENVNKILEQLDNEKKVNQNLQSKYSQLEKKEKEKILENNDGVKIVIKNNKDNKYYNKNNNYKQYYDNEEEGEQYEDEEDENN